jgi:hypothetical protein
MHCPHATKIWFGSKLGVIFDHKHTSISDWINYALNNLNEEDLVYMAAVLYGIWHARNQIFFEAKDIEDERVILSAAKSTQEYQNATSTEEINTHNSSHSRSTNQRQRSRPTTNNHWNKPNEGFTKINCDANLSREGWWGLGATYRDSDGILIAVATWESPRAADPTLAEAAALYNAVRFAIDCCFQDVVFESDNSTIINLLKDEGQIPMTYVGNIDRGIICNKGLFRSCSFRQIGREANKAAHCLAILAHEEPNRVWIEITPPQLVSVLFRDLIYH